MKSETGWAWSEETATSKDTWTEIWENRQGAGVKDDTAVVTKKARKSMYMKK